MSARQLCIAVIDPVGAVVEVVSRGDVGARVMSVAGHRRLLAAPQEIGDAIDLLVFATYGPLDWTAVRCVMDRWNTMVVATRYDRSEAAKALSRGLVGYVDGSDPAAALRSSIRRVLGGQLGFQREALAVWLRESGEPTGAYAAFTPRQGAVMTLVARGWSDDQIAGILAINPTTVRGHVRRAIARLEARNEPRAWVAEHPATGAPHKVPLVARSAAAVVLAAALSGMLAGPASAGSLPNEALYPVKLAGEAVEVMLASTPEDRTVVELSIASSRLDEAQRLAERGSAQLALETAGKYVEHLATAAASAATTERDHAASTPTVTRLTAQLALKQVEVREAAAALQADPAKRSAGGALAAVTVSPTPQAGQSIAFRLAENAGATATHLAEGTEATAPEISRQARRAETVAHAAAVTAATSLAGAIESSRSATSGPADGSVPPAADSSNPGSGDARALRPARSTGPQQTLEPPRTPEPAPALGAAPVASPAAATSHTASPTPSASPTAAASVTSPAPAAPGTPRPSPSPVPGQSPARSVTPAPTASVAPAGTVDPGTISPPLPSATPVLQKTP